MSAGALLLVGFVLAVVFTCGVVVGYHLHRARGIS